MNSWMASLGLSPYESPSKTLQGDPMQAYQTVVWGSGMCSDSCENQQMSCVSSVLLYLYELWIVENMCFSQDMSSVLCSGQRPLLEQLHCNIRYLLSIQERQQLRRRTLERHLLHHCDWKVDSSSCLAVKLTHLLLVCQKACIKIKLKACNFTTAGETGKIWGTWCGQITKGVKEAHLSLLGTIEVPWLQYPTH